MKTIILDHDLGTNPDDFFALLMLLNSTEVELALVVSGNNFPHERALLAARVIAAYSKAGATIVAGEPAGHIDFCAHSLIEGFEREIPSNYQAEIKEVLDTSDEVTYICIQGTANLSAFLQTYPEYADTFDIVHMGMSLPNASWISGGTNMEADPLGAKYLYELGLERMRVVGSHTTINDAIRVHPETALYKKIAKSTEENHQMLMWHLQDYHKRRNMWPALHDPLAVSVALGYDFVDFESTLVDFNEAGEYKAGSKTKAQLSKKEISDPEAFMQLCADLV